MDCTIDYDKIADLIYIRLAEHLDKCISPPEEESIMQRIKRLVTVNGEAHWVTGSDIQSLLNSCVKLMESVSASNITKQKDNTMFCDYAERFFETYKGDQASLTMINRDRVYGNHIKKRFANTAISDITTSSIQEWMTDLGKTLSHETLLKIKNTMSPVLDSAVEDGIIQRNPFRSNRIQIGGRETVGHKAILHDEFVRIKNEIPSLPDKEMKMAALLSYTGMRFEEVLGTMYEDIDGEWISVNRAVVHPTRNMPEIKLPKTKTSVRRIPITKKFTDLIGTGSGFILGNSDGSPLSYTQARRVFSNIRKHLGIENISAHDFRDTCATEWRESGIPIDVIARMLGHAKTDTTERRYVKYREDLINQSRSLLT